MQEGVISFRSIHFWVVKVGNFFAEDAELHVSVRQNQLQLSLGDKINMRYNQLTYHKANPFYKQDYLPDRAWLNRKPKDFPSEIPTGQDYFTYSGRKHFEERFNHSEIAATAVLQSPERYPFENRIAMEKTYMRNLDTIDIEGAASGTRLNQSIKNKLKAQEELARRHNQSLDMRDHKDSTYDEKRRQIALQQFESVQQRKAAKNQALANSRLSQNEQNTQLTQNNNPQNYRPFYADSNNYGRKQINLLPKPYYAHLQSKNPYEQEYRSIQKNENTNNGQRQQENSIPEQLNYQKQASSKQPQMHETLPEPIRSQSNKEESSYPLSMNNRHKSNPEYVNAYDAEWQRRREDFARTIQMEEAARSKIQDKKELRKYNPTNLSLNLAAQSIVSNQR